MYSCSFLLSTSFYTHNDIDTSYLCVLCGQLACGLWEDNGVCSAVLTYGSWTLLAALRAAYMLLVASM